MVNIFHKTYKNDLKVIQQKQKTWTSYGDDILEDDNLLLGAELKQLLKTDRGLTSELHLSKFCYASILTKGVITQPMQAPIVITSWCEEFFNPLEKITLLIAHPNMLHENYKALSHLRNPSTLHFVIWCDLGVAMTLHSQTSNLLQPLHHRLTLSARCHGDCRERD